VTDGRLSSGPTLRLSRACDDEAPAAAPPRAKDVTTPFIRCESHLYRSIEPARAGVFARVFRRHLLEPLIEDGLVVETDPAALNSEGMPTALRQQALPFVTYPHEWCAPMLCHAARVLVTTSLRLARRGFAFKNVRATAVQFWGTRPLVVDVASLAPLSGEPQWAGYPEFAAQFLFPLALMANGHEPIARQLLARGGIRTADVITRLRRSQLPASLLAELKANSIIRRLLRIAWHVVRPLPATRRRAPGTRTRDAVVRHLEAARDELEDLAPRLTSPSSTARIELPRPRVRRLIDGLNPGTVIDLSGGGPIDGNAATLAFHADSAICAAAYVAAQRRHDPTSALPLVIDPENLPIARGQPPYERLKADFVYADALGSGLLIATPSDLTAAVARTVCWTRRWLLVEMPPGIAQAPRPLLHELELRFHTVVRLPSDLAAGGLLLCER
jgi:hypothetical protein